MARRPPSHAVGRSLCAIRVRPLGDIFCDDFNGMHEPKAPHIADFLMFTREIIESDAQLFSKLIRAF
jgi:hypothetical protein